MRTARLAKLTLGIACSITLLLKGELMPMPEQPPREWRVPEDFPTIQAAIDAAQEGDTILIAPGVYREHLVIPKSVTLQGSSPAETILEGESSEFEPFWEEEPRLSEQGPFFVSSIQGITPYQRKVAPPAIVIQAQKVQIRSLQIRPQGWQAALEQLEGIPSLPNPLRAGVVIERGAEAFIEHVIIRHAHYGVVVRRGASLTLRHSILHNWRIGLQIWGTATVEDSSIHNEDIYEYESSEKAILVEQSGRAFLYRNRISIFHVSPYQISAHRLGDFNDGGISFYGKEITVEGNQIVGDLNYGIYISEGQASIRDNLIIHRGGSGLDIRSAKATVEGNIVIGMMPHGVGIQINPRAQATVRHNKISQNSIGIEVVGATAQLVENEVYANKNGIQLTHHWQGDGQVELVRNKVSQNEECGIAAHRYVEGKKVYEMFTGELTGEGNEVQGNLQADLCPPDYPWPPGFKK
jgi:nitrous oxidase accessory protein NosD